MVVVASKSSDVGSDSQLIIKNDYVTNEESSELARCCVDHGECQNVQGAVVLETANKLRLLDMGHVICTEHCTTSWALRGSTQPH